MVDAATAEDGDVDVDNDSEYFKSLLDLANERSNALQSHLSREESKVRQLESKSASQSRQLREVLQSVENKEHDNKFLEDECRMLREIVEDFRQKVVKLEGGVGHSILRQIRDVEISNNQRNITNDILFDSEDDDDNEDDDLFETNSILGEFDNICEEISKTGGLKTGHPPARAAAAAVVVGAAGTMRIAPNNLLELQHNTSSIFDRLTNPLHFTGSQKLAFQIKRTTKSMRHPPAAAARRDADSYVASAIVRRKKETEVENTDPFNQQLLQQQQPTSPNSSDDLVATATATGDCHGHGRHRNHFQSQRLAADFT